MEWILDFCKNCTLLLIWEDEQEDNCPGCGIAIKDRTARLQGTFSEEDGRAFIKAVQGD